MHLKNIPNEMADDIKRKAAFYGLSPSQYFIYLHVKDWPTAREFLSDETDEDILYRMRQSKSRKRKGR